MTSPASPRRRHGGVLVRLFGSLLLLPLASASALGVAATSPAAQATLVVVAPSRAAVGERMLIRLSVRDVRDLAGYEAHLAFDPSAARFSGFQQRDNDISRLGREVGALGPVEDATGVAFGAYSCPTADCLTRAGRTRSTGPAGNLHLATLEIVAQRAGILELDLGALRFVDSRGRPLRVDTSARHLTVRVGSLTRRLAAPAGAGALRPAGHAVSPDVNGDRIVNHADVLAVRSAWTSAREATSSCVALNATNEDVDGNGCIDVADVQAVAGALAGSASRRPTAYATTPGAAPNVLATWVVDSVGDAPDAGDKVTNSQDQPNGICATATGACTLRAAIFEANRHNGPDQITFAIPDSQATPNASDPDRVWRIDVPPSSPLPRIEDETGGLTIDGYTQAGAVENTSARVSNAKLKIEIRGPGEGETAASMIYGFEITSPHNTIRGLSMYRLWKKIHLLGLYHEPNGDPRTPNANNNRIVGNFLGTDAKAQYMFSTNLARTATVYMEDAAGNDVGGTTLADRNVISGSQWSGVYTTGEAANGNRVTNNIIGLSPDGTRRLGNKVIGVDLNFGSSRNVVTGNVVSGNGREGLEVSHGVTTSDNVFVGNYVGTFADGASASTAITANGWDTTDDSGGMKIEDGANGTLVHDNVFAGNILNGIFIMGGLDPATGIIHKAHHNRVYDNKIGVGVGGEDLPNVCPAGQSTCTRIGVRLQSYARSNTIGPGNEIANFSFGVWVDGAQSDRNTITRNSIHGNIRGIELLPQGIDLNGSNGLPPIDGPNDSLDHPMIATATPSEVTGQACAGCTVEVFVAQGGADVYGEGKTFVGSGIADGTGMFAADTTGLAVGDFVTATATDPLGNTSEFGLDVKVFDAALPPVGRTLARDAFSRTVTNGWTLADAGGRYTLHTPGGSSADYDVASGAGTMSVPRGSTRIATLGSLSLLDIDATVRVRVDRLPSGADEYAYLIARQTIGGDEYRLRLRLAPSGGVRLTARKFVGGFETGLGGEVLVPGLTPSTTTSIWLRVQVSSTGPTRLRMKAWRDGTSEPAAWAYVTTDTEPLLQHPGPIGLRAFVDGASTNTRVVVSFRDLFVSAADPAP